MQLLRWSWCQECILLPFLADAPFHLGLGIPDTSFSALQAYIDVALVAFVGAGPEIERIGVAFDRSNSPMARIGDGCMRIGSSFSDAPAQRLFLYLIEQVFGCYLHAAGSTLAVDCIPRWYHSWRRHASKALTLTIGSEATVAHGAGRILKRTVLDEFGIEATLTGVIDFLVEESVQGRTDAHTFACSIHIEYGSLSLGIQPHKAY